MYRISGFDFINNHRAGTGACPGKGLKLDERLEDETVWLTQPLPGELFQTTQQNINQLVLNIYEGKELIPKATPKEFLSVRQEGNRKVKRVLDFCNLQI